MSSTRATITLATIAVGLLAGCDPNSTTSTESLFSSTDNSGFVVQSVQSYGERGAVDHSVYCGNTVNGDILTEVSIPDSDAYGAINAGDPCPDGADITGNR